MSSAMYLPAGQLDDCEDSLYNLLPNLQNNQSTDISTNPQLQFAFAQIDPGAKSRELVLAGEHRATAAPDVDLLINPSASEHRNNDPAIYSSVSDQGSHSASQIDGEIFSPDSNRSQDRTRNSTSIQCWIHGCEGRTFTCLSNYRRHCKEKDSIYAKVACSRCGQQFPRKAALKVHSEKARCRILKFDANGLPYRKPLWLEQLEVGGIDQSSYGLKDLGPNACVETMRNGE